MSRRTVAECREIAVNVTAMRLALVHAAQVDVPASGSLHYDAFRAAYVALPGRREFWMRRYVREQAYRLSLRLYALSVSS